MTQEVIDAVVDKVLAELLPPHNPPQDQISHYHKTEKLLSSFKDVLPALKKAEAESNHGGDYALLKFKAMQLGTAINSISGDPYFDVIRLKYFKGVSLAETAAMLKMDVKSVTRHRRRLVQQLQIRLFPAESIQGMFEGKVC